MRVRVLNNIDLSGSESLAGKEDMQQAINKAFFLRVFQVKPNTPNTIPKEAIKRLTGANMSFEQFKSKMTFKKTFPIVTTRENKRPYYLHIPNRINYEIFCIRN